MSAAIWGFTELADAVIEGATHAVDTALLIEMLNPAGPEWMEETGRDFKALGGVGVLSVLTLTVAGLLWLQGRWQTMWFVLAAVGGGLLISTICMEGFDRPRPELVPYESAVYTASLPSGPTMMAAVTYLTLAVIIARAQPRDVMKAFLIWIATLIVVAVGISSVYLGFHWPTDLLAGWTAGAVWALLCLVVARWLEGRRGIRQEEDKGSHWPATAERRYETRSPSD